MRLKKKVNVKAHKRALSDGRVVPVKKHQREIEYIPEVLSQDWVEKMFQKRSDRSRSTDMRLNSRIMFATPNELWAEMPNMFDIWGLDGFEPPEVKELPLEGYPFQVVKYKGLIWKADKNGKFKPEENLGEIEDKKLKPPGYKFSKFDSEKKRKKFEEETGKNTVWNDKITKQYKQWLEEDYKLEKVSEKLSMKNPKMSLSELRDFYYTLDLPEDKLKKAMFKLYNDRYSNEIKSYTKDFKDFYNRRYLDVLESKIQAEKNRIKEKNKDPEKVKKSLENYYSESMINFRMPTIRKMLSSRDYTIISNADIRQTLSSYPKWKNDDIVNDLIQRYKKGDLVDTDIGDIDEELYREQQEMEGMKDYYLQKEEEQRLDYEIRKEIEDEYKSSDPELYAEQKEQEHNTIVSALSNVRDYIF